MVKADWVLKLQPEQIINEQLFRRSSILVNDTMNGKEIHQNKSKFAPQNYRIDTVQGYVPEHNMWPVSHKVAK